MVLFAKAAERVYVDEMIYGSISISSSKALIVLRDYAGEALESLLTDTMFSHNTSASRQCVSHQPFYYLLLRRRPGRYSSHIAMKKPALSAQKEFWSQ
jgi:hypothetical protein